jgi:hypothetical protein
MTVNHFVIEWIRSAQKPAPQKKEQKNGKSKSARMA